MKQDSYGPPPPLPPGGRKSPFSLTPASIIRKVVALLLIWGIGYGMYFWFVRRIVVGPGQVMVLIRQDGSRSLSGDQIIIPRAPDPTKDQAAFDKWDKEYGDANGILEEVYPEGTYFRFSPWDYNREVIDISSTAIIPPGKVGIVVKKFGQPLPVGQVLADPAKDQRGPLPAILQPGRYNDFANPYAYDVRQVDPIQVNPGYRGVVTIMAGNPTTQPNDYLVNDGEQGTQRHTEPEGFRYVNPFAQRVIPISVQSQRFQMINDAKTGIDDSIRFPSSDSFEIRLDGFVEWSIIPEKLPLIYTQYAEGGDLIPYLEEKVILPYARSFCRLVGSKYSARDFINGDTKLKFQQEFDVRLRDACEKQGIQIRQALVRNIVPPDKIMVPISEREVAKQQIITLNQQIQVAKSKADLATQEELRNQNMAIGVASQQVVTITKKAEQTADVQVTLANQQLAVAKLRLEAAKQQAQAIVARGEAEANVILLQKQAEAEPLQRQVAAFGDGQAYAQYFYFQKVAPAIKLILTTTDGPLADVFRQLGTPTTTPSVTTAPAITASGDTSDHSNKTAGVQP